MHQTIVSSDELAPHLDDPTWTIVDCRYDLNDDRWGEEQYRAAHIPRAVYASLGHDLSGPKDGRNGRHPLPGHDVMATTFGLWGIGPDVQVVAYDQDAGMYASRLWWMLRYMSHDAVAVLDGGLARWVHEGYSTRADREQWQPATFTGEPRQDWRVDVNQVLADLGNPSRMLVDARAEGRYRGESEAIDNVAGHIPGARNYFFQRNLTEDKTFRKPEELRQQWQSLLGSRPPGEVVMYCGSGVTACHNLLAMEYAGLEGARLFPGSWSEWSSDPARPIGTGSE
jgi:thiosulfate/3-mercaptopyruvate sulfurtransferase